MGNVYRTANGRQVDADGIRLANEHVIALGNLRVNARGDELGPGGRVVKTRDQVMKEYYSLNTPTAMDMVIPVTPPPVVAPVNKPVVIAPKVEEIVQFNPNSGIDPEDFAPIPQPSPAPVAKPAPVVKMVPDIIEAPVAVVPEIIQPVVVVAPAVVPVVPAPVAVAPKITSPITAKPAEQPTAPLIRGSLASAVAKKTRVEQVEKLPLNKANGVQRF
jgi:hypothetical protein